MLPDHRALGASLGTCGTHKVLPDGFQHGGTGQTLQGRCGQNTRTAHRQDVALPGIRPAGGEPPQIQGEYQQRYHIHPESRKCRQRDADDPDNVVQRRILLYRREHAQRNTDNGVGDGLQNSQPQCVREVVHDLLEHRRSVLIGIAEVQMDQIIEIVAQPLHKGQMVAQLLVEQVYLLLCGHGPQHPAARISGNGIDDGEHDDRHAQHHRDHQQQAFDNVFCHGLLL